MVRRAVAISVGIIAVGFGVYPASIDAQTEVRVAYVNTTAILQQTPGFDAADSTITALRTDFQQEADSLRAQLAAAVADGEQQQLLLNPETGQAQFDSLQGLNDQIQVRLQDMQNEVLVRQRELLAPLELRIRTVIDGLRAERGLAAVFDISNPNFALFSVDPLLNLTDIVISRLQASGSP